MALTLIAALLLSCSIDVQGIGNPIFHEDFKGSILSPSWQISQSVGNSIEVKDGAVRIRAHQNTFANVRHSPGADLVTAQCRIKPAPADSWATSMFLYWSASNWCQLGIRPMDGGRYYATEMVDGVYSEFNLAQTPFDAWHHVRIELGKDVIRFYTSEDASHWRLEHYDTRPSSFPGAPTQLILGKGYGGVEGYRNPLLANDYADKGELGTSFVDDVWISKTAQNRIHLSDRERNKTTYSLDDGLGREMLARPGGPTFEAIAARLPGIKYPREVVGVPEHPDDIGVGWDGTIQLRYYLSDTKQPLAYLELGKDRVRIGSASIPIAKSLEIGGLPLVKLSFNYAHVHYEGRIFGWSEGMSPDNPLSAFITVEATTQSPKPQRFDLRLNMSPAPTGWIPLTWSGSVSSSRPVRISAKAIHTKDWSGFSEVSTSEALHRMIEYKACWRNRLDAGLKLVTPENRVNDSYHAWMAYNFLNVDKRNGIFEIHDGSGFYEEIYAYSALLFCNALDMYGHPKDAEKYIDSLLTFQRSDGLLTLNYGLPDMGTMLLTLSDHYRFTGDKAWLTRVAPNMIRACDWLIAKRKEACLQPRKSVTYGLIKFRPYCDYPDPAYSYLSDAYAVVGMEAAVRVLRSIGRDAEAARIAGEAAVYRQDILTSMDRAKIVRDGLPILDMEPETHRLLKRSRYKGGEYYGLVAPSLLETGFLPPNDKRTHWITDFMEQRGGFICGMSEFQGGVDHAYTYGFWLTCLKQGRPDRAVLGLYGSMAGAISRNTYSGVEVMHIMTGEPEGTLPHTYSGTQQLRTLRMMLLREDGEDLEIGQAVPRGWLADGKSITIQNAPTLFGPVGIVYKSRVGSRQIEADVATQFRMAPSKIRIWFRHPSSRAIRSVSVNGKAYRDFSGEVVTLHSVSKNTRVVVRF